MKNWKAPLGDKVTVSAIEREWRQKSKYALNLCNQKRTVVQAGGNLGIFPYFLSKHFDKVITFEPIKKNIECLYDNIKGISNIEIFEAALGDENQSVNIKNEIPGNCGAIQLEYVRESEVKCVLLDEIIDYSDIDLIWLDVEGFELKALNGAAKTINKLQPILILENNGLIPEYPGDLDGSKEFRDFICKTFDYKYVNRIMRDDFFIPL